jgi:hypothetical protein
MEQNVIQPFIFEQFNRFWEVHHSQAASEMLQLVKNSPEDTQNKLLLSFEGELASRTYPPEPDA